MTALRLATLLPALLALAVIGEGVIRSASSRVAAGTLVLLACGTSLPFFVLVAPAPRAAMALLLLSLGVRLFSRAAPGLISTAALVMGAALAGLLAEGGRGLTRPPILDTLFSSPHGWLFWSPALWLGLSGLVLLARCRLRYALDLALALGALVLTVAARPAAGGPPGSAAFLAGLPLLAPGLAAALTGLARTARARPGWILAGGGALAVAWNLLFMQQYRDGLLPRDDTVSFPQVAEGSARLLSERVGSPLAWPANWWFAWRHGLPVARYDLVGGVNLLAEGRREAVIDVGRLEQDGALLLEGWSVRRPCGEDVCREVEGRARLLAPLGRPRTLDLTVRAGGSGELTVSLNGVDVGRHALRPGLGLVSTRVPAPRFRPEINELVLVVSEGGQALVDRVLFTVAED